MKMTEQTQGLSGHELGLLETKIVPTARRWLRESSQLAPHAARTLAYWGQDIVDDLGRPYTGRMQ